MKRSILQMSVVGLFAASAFSSFAAAEPSPRRVLNLPQAKDNPRNGEGAGERK